MKGLFGRTEKYCFWLIVVREKYCSGRTWIVILWGGWPTGNQPAEHGPCPLKAGQINCLGIPYGHISCFVIYSSVLLYPHPNLAAITNHYQSCSDILRSNFSKQPSCNWIRYWMDLVFPFHSQWKLVHGRAIARVGRQQERFRIWRIYRLQCIIFTGASTYSYITCIIAVVWYNCRI